MTQPPLSPAPVEDKSSAGPAVLEYATPTAKTWTVGTLTYTTGGLVLLFFWLLLGDFALSIRDRSIGPINQLFLKKEGVSDTVMVMLMSTIPGLLGLILSPVVSYRSDRLRSKWGRRIPYLLIPTPIAAAAMVGIAFTPALSGSLHAALGGHFSQKACMLAVFGTFWTLFEVAAIVSGSVFGGLINDVVPRSLLGRFYGLFRAVSLIDGMIFNYYILEHAEQHFTAIYVAVAAVFGVGFVLMCLQVKEGNYPPVHELESNRPERRGFINAVETYFRECFTHPYYLLCFLLFTVGAAAFQPINFFNLSYAKHIDMNMALFGKLTAYCYMVSLILAWPLGWLVDRFHPIRVAMAAIVLYILATGWGAFCIVDPKTFAVAYCAHVVLSGTYFTASASLGQRLLPRTKFTQFASAAGILGTLGGMSTNFVMGGILDLTGHKYRLTYLGSFLLSCVCLVLFVIVHHRFMALGGPKGYVAPGDDPELESPEQVAPRGH